jgi:hypothetical protein
VKIFFERCPTEFWYFGGAVLIGYGASIVHRSRRQLWVGLGFILLGVIIHFLGFHYVGIFRGHGGDGLETGPVNL